MPSDKILWDQFDITYYYPFPLEKVFNTWATSGGLESFFLEDAETLNERRICRAPDEQAQTGDSFHWLWRHNYSLLGKFLKVEKNKLIDFSFGKMEVSLLFTELPEGVTVLQLQQTKIPTAIEDKAHSHMNCRICWTFFLTNLKSVLLNGTDLRDDKPSRASSFEVGFVPVEIPARKVAPTS